MSIAQCVDALRYFECVAFRNHCIQTAVENAWCACELPMNTHFVLTGAPRVRSLAWHPASLVHTPPIQGQFLRVNDKVPFAYTRIWKGWTHSLICIAEEYINRMNKTVWCNWLWNVEWLLWKVVARKAEGYVHMKEIWLRLWPTQLLWQPLARVWTLQPSCLTRLLCCDSVAWVRLLQEFSFIRSCSGAAF